MPISPETMKLYPGGSIRSPEWRAIVERSGWQCEACKAPHRALIYHGEHDDAGTYMVLDDRHGTVFDAETGDVLRAVTDPVDFDGHPVTIILR